MDFKFVRGLFFVFLVGGVSLFFFFMRPSEDRPVPEVEDSWRTAEEDVHLDGIHFREWKKGELTEAKIHANTDGSFRIYSDNKLSEVISLRKGQSMSWPE